MKKRSSYLFILLPMIFALSCTQGLKRTKSGLLYKIISDGKGPVVKKGEFLKFNWMQKVRDSVLRTSYNNFPAYSPVDSVGNIYDPAEVFPLLRKGDSLVVVMLVDTIKKKFGGQLPPFFKKNDKIILTFKVLDILASQDAALEDRKKMFDAEKDKEVKVIQDFLAKNNIKDVKSTSNGVFYQITSPGNGPKVDSGKYVSVKYTGYDFNGKPFDSNQDSAKQLQHHPLEAFQFRAGVSGAIPGMVEAITEFKKGDKGKMYIPSMLGYGPQGSPPAIEPFENLVFDVEVVDISDTAAHPQRSAGSITPEQLQKLREQMQKKAK
ncbi:MAG TPA: FKBP-type peptidyl-prolyl cis-trans isomerase [Puia sp.]|nr:FKBP-type peptidyl-prolyl cis-trans isomerase [Puia sp.]